MKKSLKKLAESLAPDYTRRVLESRWLRQHAREFASAIHSETSIETRVDYARGYIRLRSNQKRAEIVALLKLLESDRPRRMCEIGADRGGTLALFASVAAADARILSLDIHYPESRARLYRTLAKPDQEVTCIEADSHALDTVRKAKAWLRGQALDFLFIDGDHSYAGVKADFLSYSPLVRPGGVIAFHDIVKDARMRSGKTSLSNVGDVPIYWNELKASVPGCLEFIEDPNQDGYGIGVIKVTAA